MAPPRNLPYFRQKTFFYRRQVDSLDMLHGNQGFHGIP